MKQEGFGMPLNPEAQPTATERARQALEEGGNALHRRAAYIATFLSGIIIGYFFGGG